MWDWRRTERCGTDWPAIAVAAGRWVALAMVCMALEYGQTGVAAPVRFAILVPGETAPPDQTIRQVVLNAPAATVYSMDLRLTYDPPTAPVLGIQVGTLATGMMLATNIPQPGVILAGLASASPFGGEGAVLSVTFGVPTGVTLALAEASINEGSLSSAITVNTAPVLSVPPDQIISRLQTLTITNVVTDADVPTNALSFAMVSGPDGVSVDVRTGVLTWTPNISQGPSINLISVKASDNGVPALSATNSFSVNVPGRIAGAVRYYPTNYPASCPSVKTLGGVTMSLAGDTTGSNETASDGSYTFDSVPAGGTYAVAPGRSTDSPTANGVSTLDIALIRQHILSGGMVSQLATPYKLLAADVNGSKTVSTLDLALIRQVVLGSPNPFPPGFWRFVPADYVFPDANTPWDAPTHWGHTNLLADMAGQDFVAIKLGDVNDSWLPPMEGQSVRDAAFSRVTTQVTAEPKLRFQAEDRIAPPGTRVRVEVGAQGCRGLTSAQFTLSWDPAVLQYVRVDSYGLGGLSADSFGTRLVPEGKLMLAWDDPGAEGVTLANETPLFSIEFEVIGVAGSRSALVLGDDPTAREASVNFERAALATKAGQVFVMANPDVRIVEAVYSEGGFHLSVTTETGWLYGLEFADALPAAQWTALPAVLGDGTVKILTDPVATNIQRYYRVRLE